MIPFKTRIKSGVVQRLDVLESLTYQGVPVIPGGGGSGGAGTNGREVELRANATHIQWRYVGDPSWIDLVALSVITGTDGDDGREVELQANATHLQWRYVGTATWTDLVPLSTITGPQGAAGAAGAAGQGVPTGGIAGQTLIKISGTDYDTAWGPRFSYGTAAPTGGQDGDWYAQLV